MTLTHFALSALGIYHIHRHRRHHYFTAPCPHAELFVIQVVAILYTANYPAPHSGHQNRIYAHIRKDVEPLFIVVGDRSKKTQSYTTFIESSKTGVHQWIRPKQTIKYGHRHERNKRTFRLLCLCFALMFSAIPIPEQECTVRRRKINLVLLLWA